MALTKEVFLDAAKNDVAQTILAIAKVERGLPRDEAWARGLPTAVHDALRALYRLQSKLKDK